MKVKWGLFFLIMLPPSFIAQRDPFYFQEVIPDPDSLENVLSKSNDEFANVNIHREPGFAFYENKRDSALFNGNINYYSTTRQLAT